LRSQAFLKDEKVRICIRLLCGQERGGWINPKLFGGLASNLQLFNVRQHEAQIGMLVDLTPIEYARNRASMDALEMGADWLLMIDNDQVIPDNLVELIEEAHSSPAVNIVSIATWMMRRAQISPFPMVNNMPVCDTAAEKRIPERLWLKWQKTWAERIGHPYPGFQEVSSGGAGVMLIRRSVLERIKAPWFHMPLDQQTGEGRGGEDDYFCARATEAGFKIHCHRGFTCGHLKTVDLRGFAAHINFPPF
jgi:GT2 family glycosyltransferase